MTLIGNPDSKYAYQPNKLDEDIKVKQHEHKVFKDLVKHLIIMEPAKMDLRYKDVIDVLKEVKEEYGM